MKTISLNVNTVDKKWVVVDAADQVLGRIATKVAAIIRGKTNPTFTPHVDCGDNVIIINAAKVKLTGAKWDQKIYYHHTGFPGGIKSATDKEMREKKPSSLLKKPFKVCCPKIDWEKHWLAICEFMTTTNILTPRKIQRPFPSEA